MVSISNLMSKDGSVFVGLISVRRTVTIAMLLVVCALAPWSHSATADEINATTTAKPVGFAEIVAKVKPAVIAVTVRLESGAQMESEEPDTLSQFQRELTLEPPLLRQPSAPAIARSADQNGLGIRLLCFL
jgi:hypothetical protein